MNNLHVRKGDNVKVLTGKDKGKTGKILATDPKTAMVLVEGVNIATHHIKPRSATEQGGRKKVEAPIAASNVQIICPSCGKSVRARHQEIDGKNARVCAKCGASLDAALKADKADKKAKKAADKKAKKAKDEATEEVAEETKAKKTTAKKTNKKAETTEVPVDNGTDGKTE
ncbi:MAG: 50S ribosomal protein L24 [Clostridiales bacterium]|nr:50S ribosomal protein L24 [Clostridiales bacterium]MDE6618794.1 50S ribosomal protein L24 [Clostridiales bacterium]